MDEFTSALIPKKKQKTILTRFIPDAWLPNLVNVSFLQAPRFFGG
jgi:hypothetical protein